MATGHFFKRWDDVGAPQMNQGAGNMIAMLDWALDVAGAVYWEKVYSGTNKAVYRSKTGIRPYLRVDDTNPNTAIVTMYETMSDVDTGTGPCPDGVNQVSNSMRWVKGYNTSASTYFIVGDSEYFIHMVEIDTRYRLSGETGNFAAMNYRTGAFGEIASYLAVDSYPCILMGSYTTSDGSQYNSATINLTGNTTMGGITGWGSDNSNIGDPKQTHLLWLKTADGVADSSGGYAYTNNSHWAFHRMAAENPFFYSPYNIQCSDASTSSSSQYFWGLTNPTAVMRGRLPYFYVCNTIYGSAYGGPQNLDSVAVGASEFTYIYNSLSGTSAPDYDNYHGILLRITDDEPDRP